MNRKTPLAVLFVALIATSGIAAAVGGPVNWGSSPAPETELVRTEEKATHDMEWGDSAEALRYYENNNGERVMLDARVNESADNPISFVPTDIESDTLHMFPHAKDGVNVTDTSEWTVDASGSAGSGSVSSVQTATGVEAIELSASSQTSGDTMVFSFSNFSVTADENKHYFTVGQDVTALASGATVEYQIVDADGDYKNATIEPGASTSNDGVMANQTGEGYVYQRQLGNMATYGSGDGNFDDIESVEVVVTDADATVQVPHFNLDKMSPYTYGAKMVDQDGDGELEEVTIEDKKAPGRMKVHSLKTLGSAFDTAKIHHMQIDMVERGEHQPDKNVYLNTTQTDKYPSYHGTATIAVRFSHPDQYELSPSNLVLRDTQAVTSDRLISVEYAEGVSTSDEVDQDMIDSTSFSDVTSQYGSEGKEVQLDSTVTSGDGLLVKYELKLTEDEFDAIQAATGGGGGTGAQSSGGIGSIPVIGTVFLMVMGLLRKLGA